MVGAIDHQNVVLSIAAMSYIWGGVGWHFTTGDRDCEMWTSEPLYHCGKWSPGKYHTVIDIPVIS